MNYIENYHTWLRDAHAMEKQAEKMLIAISGRNEHLPEIRQRIEHHLTETQHQLALLEEIIKRNNISPSLLKDTMGKMMALGQSIGGMFISDELVKDAINSYVFAQFEVACYTSLISAAKLAGDEMSVPVFESLVKQEKARAKWALNHLPEITEQFLQRSASHETAIHK